MASKNSPIQAALLFLREYRHWYIFPIKADAKYPPSFPDNLALASNNLATIRQWEAEYPGANWGLSLKKSGVIVVDVDTRSGKRGRETLERLELEHGSLPPTTVIRSPSGGLHYHFREANGVTHRTRVSAFGPDVDSTNYVLLPGSTVGGVPYVVVDHTPIAPAPAWFGEYLVASTIGDNSQVPAVEQDMPDLIAWAVHYLEHDAPPSIQFKNGEWTLLMVAAVLKDHGISEDMAVELLGIHYNVPGKCEPLWDVGEGPIADRLDVKVHNVWSYLKQTQPGANTARAVFGDAPIDAAALDRTVEWHRRRAAAIASGEQPTNRERAAMQKKKDDDNERE